MRKNKPAARVRACSLCKSPWTIDRNNNKLGSLRAMAMRATVCQAMRHHNHITSHIQPTHTLTQISTEHLTMYTFTVYIWIWILHNQNEYIFFFVQHTTCNEFVFFFCFLHIKEITVLYDQICKMFIFHWSFSIECRWKLVWRNGEMDRTPTCYEWESFLCVARNGIFQK